MTIEQKIAGYIGLCLALLGIAMCLLAIGICIILVMPGAALYEIGYYVAKKSNIFEV